MTPNGIDIFNLMTLCTIGNRVATTMQVAYLQPILYLWELVLVLKNWIYLTVKNAVEGPGFLKNPAGQMP